MRHLSLGPPMALHWSCNEMRLDHDPPADAVYIWLRDLPYAFGEDLDLRAALTMQLTMQLTESRSASNC